MIEKILNKWKDSIPHITVVVKQLWVPAVLAALYGVWDWSTSESTFSLSKYIKVTLPALFLLMWFVGLYERAKKRESDSKSFETINQNIESLTELINQLQPAPVEEIELEEEVEQSYAQKLVYEAIKVFESGYKLAALLEAGVAYEQAIRAFAKAHDIINTDQIPLIHILNKLNSVLPPGIEDQFHSLRKIRNQLAHASESELHHIENAENLLNTYRWAVNVLTLNSGFYNFKNA